MLFALLVATPGHARILQVVTLDSAPLAFEQDGEVVGVAADLVREGLRRMGYGVEIRIVPWIRALHMVRYGDADAVFPAGYNAERAGWFHYPAQNLFEVKVVPVKRSDTPIDFSLDRFDYSKYKLGEVRGGYFGPNHKRFMEAALFKEVEQTSSTTPNINKLRDKRIDLFITPYHEAKYLIRTMGLSEELEIITGKDGVPLVVDRSEVHLAFSRQLYSDAIAGRFADAVLSMKLDGTYDQVYKKYY